MSIDVSIIIPNYNGAAYLREAIDSAVSQAGVEVEVIVVDDGSTDASREVIDSYGDSIHSIFQKNLGACAARNAGLAIARGESVIFLDSDDLLYPDALKRLYLALGGVEEKSAVYGDARWMEREKLLRHDNTQLPSDMGVIAGLIGQNLLTGRVLHRTDNVRAVGGFDIKLPRGQEFDMHFRLALQNVRFIHYPADVLYYRIHSSEHRISAKGFSGIDPGYLLSLNDSHRALLEEEFGNEWPGYVRMRMAKRLWEIGRGLIREGNELIATEYFAQSKALVVSGGNSGSKLYCLVNHVLGPVYTERLLMRCRQLFRRRSR